MKTSRNIKKPELPKKSEEAKKQRKPKKPQGIFS